MNVLSSSRRYAFATVVGLSLLAASAAQAFTIDDQNGANSSGGSARYADPDARRFGNTNDGRTTIQQGNTTLQFGAQRPLDYQAHKEQMFEPNGRPVGER